MNIQNFLQTGGFPLETDTLDAMQTAYALFNALGEIAGDKSIVKGCVVAGSTTGDGVVYINGELYEFVGGNTQATVRIIEVASSKVFENGETHETHYRRYVTFATGVGSIPWDDFVRINPLLEIQKALVPVGMISMWSGTIEDIPALWALCDGTNGTPNLKGKFIVGYDAEDADYDAIGDNGGAKKVTPAGSNSSQSVNVTLPRDGWGTSGSGLGSVASGRLVVGSGASEGGEFLESLRAAGNSPNVASGSHSHTFSGTEHENRPPYYTLAYIIYKGA